MFAAIAKYVVGWCANNRGREANVLSIIRKVIQKVEQEFKGVDNVDGVEAPYEGVRGGAEQSSPKGHSCHLVKTIINTIDHKVEIPITFGRCVPSCTTTPRRETPNKTFKRGDF